MLMSLTNFYTLRAEKFGHHHPHQHGNHNNTNVSQIVTINDEKVSIILHDDNINCGQFNSLVVRENNNNPNLL